MNLDFFLIALVAVVLTLVFRREWRYEQDRMRYLNPPKLGRRVQILNPLKAPIVLGCVALLCLLIGAWDGFERYLPDLLLRTCLYYLLLLILLPLLRRIISARACATAWLLPNLTAMFPVVYLQNYRPRPFLVIRVSQKLAVVGIWVWAIGSAAVLGLSIYEHFSLRRRLLKDARPVTQEDVLELWRRELRAAEIKEELQLYRSPTANSPITVGLIRKHTVCILPIREYSLQQLRLIFRHELRHVARGDSQAKLFSAILTAVCWPNPLVWIAQRKAAEDLELSCDEMVLTSEDEKTRKSYAELLITPAGSDKGFTTCLSSAAKTLRHRLKCVVKPPKRLSGAVVVGLLSLVLGFTGGWISISTLSGSMDELIFDPNPHGPIGRIYTCTRTVSTAFEVQDDDDEKLYAWDEEALVDYLGDMQLRRLDSAIWDHGCSGYVLEIFYDSAGDIGRIMLNDDMLTVSTFSSYKGNRNMRLDYYQVTSPIDWDYIHSLLDYDAPNPDPNPVLPYMVFTVVPDVFDGEQQWMNGECLRKHDATGTTEDPYTHRNEDGACYFHGTDITALRFDFSYDPDNMYIRIEPFEGDSYVIDAESLEKGTDGYTLLLLEESAIYHIGGSFSSHRNTVFVMEFHVHIIRQEDASIEQLQRTPADFAGARLPQIGG